MSKGVYLSKNDGATTPQEDTPVSMRSQARHTTVHALHCRLQDAYRRDAGRVGRRIRGLLELLTPQATVPVLCERWGRSPAGLWAWPQAGRRRGLASLVSRHGGGRPEQWPAQAQPRWGELLAAGARVGGGETAGWHGGLLRGLRGRALGGLSTRP
jgi:hypothetical protein